MEEVRTEADRWYQAQGSASERLDDATSQNLGPSATTDRAQARTAASSSASNTVKDFTQPRPFPVVVDDPSKPIATQYLRL